MHRKRATATACYDCTHVASIVMTPSFPGFFFSAAAFCRPVRPARLPWLVLALGLFISSLSSQAVSKQDRISPAAAIQTGFLYRTLIVDGVEYRYAIYVPPAYTPARQWPIVLALHGSGRFGTDGHSQLEEGLPGPITRYPDRFPVIVVFSQSHLDGMAGWHGLDGKAAMAELDKTIAEFNVDTNRTYLTGMSAGGNGAWFLASKYPERFAALAVVCGYVSEEHGGTRYPSIAPPGTTDLYTFVAQRVASIPTWIFHGSADAVVPVEESRRMYQALKAVGANVQYTEYPGVDHAAWNWTYEQPPMITWMLEQRKK